MDLNYVLPFTWAGERIPDTFFTISKKKFRQTKTTPIIRILKAMEKGTRNWEKPKLNINRESIFDLMKKNRTAVNLGIASNLTDKKLRDFINSVKKPKK